MYIGAIKHNLMNHLNEINVTSLTNYAVRLT